MSSFAWGAPRILWFLLILPLYLGLGYLGTRKTMALLGEWIAPKMWHVVFPGFTPGGRLQRLWLRAFVFLFAILALARPQWGTQEELLKITGLDVMLVLDVSTSMLVEDMIPSRLQKAKHVIRTFGERLRGDRLGLIAFAGSSFVACPITTDTEYAVESAQMMTSKMVTHQGTDIGLALETALLAMKRGGEAQDSGSSGVLAPDASEGSSGARQDRPPTTQAVILITDGEDHEGSAIPMAQRLRDEKVNLYILGVGTQKGGPIPVRDDQGALHGYKRDRTGQPVISQFSPESLLQLAQAAGGRYWSVTDSEAEVDEILQDLGGLNRNELAERKLVIRQERFQWPLMLAVFLLWVELTLGIAGRRHKSGFEILRSGHGSKLGTKNQALLGLFWIVVGIGAGGASDARADRSWMSRQTPWEVYQSNREGLEALNLGRVDEARTHIGSAQASRPDLPELEFNRGHVEQKSENTEAAIQAFDRSAERAGTLGDEDLRGKAEYNSAYLRAKKGDFSGAVEKYSRALESAQKARNQELEDRVRKNLELLVEEEKKQQKQKNESGEGESKDDPQQNQQDKSSNNQQDNKDKNSNQQDKAQKNKQEQGKQPKEMKQRKQEFKSGKMSKEDAERVMNELSTKEKDLREKLRKKTGSPQANEKDW